LDEVKKHVIDASIQILLFRHYRQLDKQDYIKAQNDKNHGVDK
jgi:hypothetical protein